MSRTLDRRLGAELDAFRADGVYKKLNYLESPQAARVRMEGRGEVIILSSNNYLGLSNQPDVVAAGKAALDRYGAGTASVRFICGTFDVHRDLEAACARLVGTPARRRPGRCWASRTSSSATSSTTRPSSTGSGWPRRSRSARPRSTATATSITSPSCSPRRRTAGCAW
jgi:glycine C-acetyltransferase